MDMSGCKNLNKALSVGFILGIVLSMSACGSGTRVGQEESKTITLVPSPVETTSRSSESAVPTRTPRNTPASLNPSVTKTVSLSPTPISTPAFGSARVGNDFLFGNQAENCELPCWQGLRVGQSDADDVQHMFEVAFGFSESQDLVGDTTESSDVPGMIAITQIWIMVPSAPKTREESFAASVWLDKDVQIVEAIEFFADSPRFQLYISPQQLLRKLGGPSNMLVQVGRGEEAEKGIAMLMMSYYDKGITVVYTLPISVNIMNINDSSDDIATLCLGESSRIYGVAVYLTEPLNGGLDILSPLQQFLFGDTIETSNPPFVPFETLFGITFEEITKLAEQQANPCVSSKPAGENW